MVVTFHFSVFRGIWRSVVAAAADASMIEISPAICCVSVASGAAVDVAKK